MSLIDSGLRVKFYLKGSYSIARLAHIRMSLQNPFYEYLDRIYSPAETKIFSKIHGRFPQGDYPYAARMILSTPYSMSSSKSYLGIEVELPAYQAIGSFNGDICIRGTIGLGYKATCYSWAPTVQMYPTNPFLVSK